MNFSLNSIFPLSIKYSHDRLEPKVISMISYILIDIQLGSFKNKYAYICMC